MARHCEYVQQLKHMKVQLKEIEDIIERHKTIKEWAYIIHDKDTDKNGYNVLDVVFGDAMEAELVVVPYEMKDDHGKVVKGNTYAVRSYDEDGTVYECPIKPARTSDKSFLNMLLR